MAPSCGVKFGSMRVLLAPVDAVADRDLLARLRDWVGGSSRVGEWARFGALLAGGGRTPRDWSLVGRVIHETSQQDRPCPPPPNFRFGGGSAPSDEVKLGEGSIHLGPVRVAASSDFQLGFGALQGSTCAQAALGLLLGARFGVAGAFWVRVRIRINEWSTPGAVFRTQVGGASQGSSQWDGPWALPF